VQNLRLPERFLRLKDEQQAGRGAAASRARRVGSTLWRQHGAQSRRLSVWHHPEGDPRGIPCGARQDNARTMSGPASAVSKAASPEVAQAHITRLRSMLEQP